MVSANEASRAEPAGAALKINFTADDRRALFSLSLSLSLSFSIANITSPAPPLPPRFLPLGDILIEQTSYFFQCTPGRSSMGEGGGGGGEEKG